MGFNSLSTGAGDARPSRVPPSLLTGGLKEPLRPRGFLHHLHESPHRSWQLRHP